MREQVIENAQSWAALRAYHRRQNINVANGFQKSGLAQNCAGSTTVHETRQHAETPEIVEGVSPYAPGQSKIEP